MAAMACSPKQRSGGSNARTACRPPGLPARARSRFWPSPSHPSAGRTRSRKRRRHRRHDRTSARGRRAPPWPPRLGQRPASAARRVPRGSAHRPRSGSVPWMIILGGLALALALVLIARLAHRFPPESALAQRGPVRRPGEGGRRCEIGAARADRPHHAERRSRSPRQNQRDPDSHQRASRQSQCGWHRQWREQQAVSGTRGRSPRAGRDRWRFQPRPATRWPRGRG